MDDRWRSEHYKKRLLRSASGKQIAISSSNSVEGSTEMSRKAKNMPQKRKIELDSSQDEILGRVPKFTIKRIMVTPKTAQKQTTVVEPQPSTSGIQRNKPPQFTHNIPQIQILNPQIQFETQNIKLSARNQNKRQSMVPFANQTFLNQQQYGMWQKQNVEPRPSTNHLPPGFEPRPSTSGIQTMEQLPQNSNVPYIPNSIEEYFGPQRCRMIQPSQLVFSPPTYQDAIRNLRREAEAITNIIPTSETSQRNLVVKPETASNEELSVRPSNSYVSILNTGHFVNNSSILNFGQTVKPKKQKMVFSSLMPATIKAEARDVLTANQYVEELEMVAQFATLSKEGRYIYEFYKFLTKVQIMSDGRPISFRLFRKLYQEHKFDDLERKFAKYNLE